MRREAGVSLIVHSRTILRIFRPAAARTKVCRAVQKHWERPLAVEKTIMSEKEKPVVNKGLLADVYPATVDGTQRHKTFGWTFNAELSADDNYMDLAALVARNSLCTGGHMGCVLVKDGEVKAIATNTPLFQPYASDVHAEVNAISGCARKGHDTAGATAYITMPPCKHCFMVLQAAGIARVVCRHPTLLENCSRAASELGITWGVVKDSPECEERRAKYIEIALEGNEEHQKAVVAERLARKKAKQEAHAAREIRKQLEGEQAQERETLKALSSLAIVGR